MLSFHGYLKGFRTNPLRSAFAHVPGEAYPRSLEETTTWSLDEVEKRDSTGLVRVILEFLAVVVDVEGFGDLRRTNLHQRGVHDGLYQVVRKAFDTVGVPWEACYHEDRGDAVFILAPSLTSKAVFVETLPHMMITRLRVHNDTHPDAQIRLRMALHAGEVPASM